MYSAGPVEGS